MKRSLLTLLAIISVAAFHSDVKADFGDADFPEGMFDAGPKSYHDAWCRKIKNECRLRFQGPGMWVEGQGGIQSSQLIKYRYDIDGDEHYNYITYKAQNGREQNALFLFANWDAQREFMRAFGRWRKEIAIPIPNYRLPNSQGPQDTQGRDKGLNPYDNPPITDWSEKTTKERDPKCNSPVYRNKPECRE